jgi:hypothetical protein
MNQRHIIFVPGKNPKPPADQHQSLLWRTMVEGVRRAEPHVVNEFDQHAENFKLIAWNYLYYHATKDINRDLPWIDALINQHGPTEQKPGTVNSIGFFTVLSITYLFYSDYCPIKFALPPKKPNAIFITEIILPVVCANC